MSGEERKVIENKIVVLGHTGVGKTSLVNQYVRGTFQGNSTTTIGAAYTQKFIDVQNYRVSLQIWDTAGQERFRSMVRASAPRREESRDE